MNAMTRFILILAVVAGACGLAWKYTPHHKTDNVFTTLYMHVMPAQLDKNAHAYDEAGNHMPTELLLSVDLPEALSIIDMDAGTEGAQLVLTNLQIFQIAAVLLCFICFLGLPAKIRSGSVDKLSGFFVGWAMWIRDEMVYPVMGKSDGAKYLPYFLSIFFFIVFMNLMGLVPFSATATASLAVTGALAITTFAMMLVCGMAVQGPVAFWKNLVPHVPLALWPLMFVVEVVGLCVKPFALMIRLFANMTGGHMVVLSFLGLIFFFGQDTAGLGYAVSPIAIAFAVFIMIIEVFVALLQAYIFTQLSILFIGGSIHPEH